MPRPILEQYHARVKHKEPFSRCCPLWRSLFWRQPWQGPQGRLSLSCDTDCPIRAVPELQGRRPPRTLRTPPGADLRTVRGGRTGLTCRAHLRLRGCRSPEAGSEREGADKAASSNKKGRRSHPELQVEIRTRSWASPSQVKRAGKVTHSVTRWCI